LDSVFADSGFVEPIKAIGTRISKLEIRIILSKESNEIMGNSSRLI
jgi:hypothetical protein